MKALALSNKRIAGLGLGLAMALGITLSHAQEADTRAYEVRITNITAANQFTPVLAVAHSRRASLFTLGSAPRTALAVLAETGNTADLQGRLLVNGNVGAAETFTPGDTPLTFAGETLEFTLETAQDFRYFSMAAMILPTNDSFAALDTVTLPTSGSVAYYALGYDAGSEMNDEMCVNIPGPTCGGSGEFSGLNGEGFVHISSGIHGNGDLNNAVYDWRNPIAKVVITRVR